MKKKELESSEVHKQTFILLSWVNSHVLDGTLQISV